MPKQIFIPLIDLKKENLDKVAKLYPEPITFFVQPKEGGIGIVRLKLEDLIDAYHGSETMEMLLSGCEIQFEVNYIFQKVGCRIQNKHQHGKHADKYMLWEDREVEKRFV